MPWRLHIPCHSAEHSCSSCRCVVGMAAGGVLPGQSCVCVFMMLLPGSGKCLLLLLCFQQR